MNNRFKFRVFDETEKAYINRNFFMSLDGQLCFLIAGSYPHWRIFQNTDWCIIEQCTGLTDKNGKLIYEGDVVKTKDFGKDIDNRINVSAYDTFVVKFHECGFYIENDSRRFHMSYRPKLEIIGNIHDDQFREVTKKVEE